MHLLTPVPRPNATCAAVSRPVLARLREASRCTCTTATTETPGLRQYVWDPDCPQHRVEPEPPRGA
jgi:hypothetical protein